MSKRIEVGDWVSGRPGCSLPNDFFAEHGNKEEYLVTSFSGDREFVRFDNRSNGYNLSQFVFTKQRPLEFFRPVVLTQYGKVVRSESGEFGIIKNHRFEPLTPEHELQIIHYLKRQQPLEDTLFRL